MSNSVPGSAFEGVIHKMLTFIESENLAPGDALPSERSLAQRFKVSRHTLREAIRVMQEKGVLRIRRGSGTYVAPISDKDLAAAMSACIPGEKDRLFEIFQFREIVEPQIAALAAEMARPDQIIELESLIEKQAQSTNASEIMEIDSQFHISLAYMTGNRILADIVEKINEALSLARSEHHYSSDRQQKSVSGHRAIVAALRSGSSDKAQSAMKNHIKQISDAVLKTSN